MRPAVAAGLATVALSTALAGQTLASSRALGDTTISSPSPRSTAPDSASAAARAKLKPRTDSAKVPFAFADFTWLNGNSRQKTSVLDSKYFTGEFRVDATYIYDFNRPKDHTLVGTSESGRTQEVQVQQLGIGGDFHTEHARGRLMTQFGMYSTMTPRNDASPSRGQWQLHDAYRYISEAYGGYHWDKMNGINFDAGIFMSYVGLFSYYNFDNWAYQPSYVSSNTPWFFNGVRIQIFPSDKLKIEPWIVNGWQSYGMFNEAPGLGVQILWRPNGSVSLLGNQYYGKDWLGLPDRWRVHSDNSLTLKYFDRPGNGYDKGAFSLTVDAGCESGAGVSCKGGDAANPAQNFLGFMLYNRSWFANDRIGLTLGGGAMKNPGRYLVLVPPINGATATSGTKYFTANPGDQFKGWDVSATLDYMPDQFVTFRGEFDTRGSSVPYFAGRGGVTPQNGNTGDPGSLVDNFTPDLRKRETRLNFALLVKF